MDSIFIQSFSLTIACLLALIADRLLGEPQLHPLILFGNAASWLERKLNNQKSIARGSIAAFVLLLPLTILTYWVQTHATASTATTLFFNVVILYFVIGWQSMKQHATNIEKPLRENDIESARQQLSMIVSRETKDMEQPKIIGSTVESILENGHDCLFASLFWFVVLGPAGALFHRLSNTLDAMWGYKNEQYLYFGKFAAHLDDILGYIPARLTAISYALVGTFKPAINSWRTQAKHHPSPNAGVAMATGAGAIECTIGGSATYQGKLIEKPLLGAGEKATITHIKQSIRLVEKSVAIWIIVIFAIELILYLGTT